MTATFTLGPCPAEEEPAQLGRTPDFDRLNRLEVDCYRAALIAYYGPPPLAARFRHQASSHDFGRYVELALRFDDNDEDAVRYAMLVDQGLARWFHAGFTAPVDYAPGRNPTVHQADITAAIRSAVRIMRPPYPDGERMIANLRAYYPQHAG